MVGKGYMVDKARPPSASRTFLHLSVLPALIDTAGAAERVLEQVAIQCRIRPATAVGAAFGAGLGLAILRARGVPGT